MTALDAAQQHQLAPAAAPLTALPPAAALPLAAAASEPGNEKVRKGGYKRKSPNDVPAPVGAAPARSAAGGGDTINARIIQALGKKPMSSMELAQFLNLEEKQAYQACSYLKNNDRIESFVDDAVDGSRRYRLPVAA